MSTPISAEMSTSVGLPPGTLIDEPNASAKLRVLAYGPDKFVEREYTIDKLPSREELTRLGQILWIDVDGNRDANIVRGLGQRFGLHALELEDVNKGGQRPKLEDYGEHLFVVARIIDDDAEELDTEQTNLFLGRGFVVTIQERPGDCFEPVRERIRTARGRIRSAGSDYLAYALLDAAIDHFGVVVEAYGDRLEDLERDVLAGDVDTALPILMDTRHDLHTLRRLAMGTRKLVDKLIAREVELVEDETRTYLRDCQDHSLRLLETIDSFRELGTNLMDLHLALAGQQLNAIMKVLTIMSTIFIPLSFIAGLYGMNFEPGASPLNMPELGWHYGYPFALGLMLVVVLGQLAYFRRRGWLKG